MGLVLNMASPNMGALRSVFSRKDVKTKTFLERSFTTPLHKRWQHSDLENVDIRGAAMTEFHILSFLTGTSSP